MKNYIVHFKDNRAFSAAEVDIIASTEIKKIEGTTIEWVIVPADNESDALVAADNFIDNLIGDIIDQSEKRRLGK